MHAWPDLVRIERLGIMTCQRGSDLIRMGPKFRDGNGIWCQPKKTRKRRRVFHIPLATTGALEFDRWWVGDQVKKYKWDIDLTTQTIRPFTGSAAPASWRAEHGYDVDQIANDIGRSRQNLDHYMRFRDPM